MHGFLNVFVAAGFVFAGIDEKQVIAILGESSVDAFSISDDSLSWGPHRLSLDQIEASRSRFALSFGSCSFEEPIEDLKGIHLL
jgi:hypothetical protein